MNNNLLQLKIKQRLNKLSSNDYDSFECWMIVEAFNKVQLERVRNAAKQGEATNGLVDDFGILLNETDLIGQNKPIYYESQELPKDYLAGDRVSFLGVHKDCKEPRIFKVYDGEEKNLDELLKDPNKNPNFEWAETFKTQVSNTIRIYTDGKFQVTKPRLIYYRNPRPIAIEGCVNEYDELTSNVECEFRDDLVESLIDETAGLLAGDIESINQYQRLSRQPQQTQNNTKQ